MAVMQMPAVSRVVVLCCLVVLAVSLHVEVVAAAFGRNPGYGAGNGLRRGFYAGSCRNVERIVFSSMQSSYNYDKSIAPGVLRASFHDCFVRGCDCSFMLNGPGTERTSFANNFRQSTLDAIDAAKKAVEKVCPGIVSCADVLQFAARDAVILAGGGGWAVPAGRRDGSISLASEANANLPPPVFKAPQLIALFQKKGLSINQMVALSGAHTIGTAACATIDNRLFGTSRDPTLPLLLLSSLLRQCPTPRFANRVAFDSTPQRFDEQYFLGVAGGRGVLTSDQALMEDPRTRSQVFTNLLPFVARQNFGDAMIALSQLDVLTGTQGEIRLDVYTVNT